MTSNPFAPPQSAVDDPPEPHGLRRSSPVLVFFLVTFTFGIYWVVWFIRRRPALNRLNSPAKLALWPLLLAGLHQCFDLAMTALTIDTTPAAVMGEDLALVANLWRIVIAVLMLMQAFKARNIIEDHATPAGAAMFAGQVRLSGLMTFFFSVVYLQWAINRYIVDASDTGAPRA